MKNYSSKFKVIRNFLFLIAIFHFSFFIFHLCQGAGASLYLSPSSGTYTVGSTFSAVVKVNSAGETINAAEGTLIFNPAELQVEGLSKTGSIFSLWTNEPTFSNSAGNIVFGGGTPNNFSGTSGTTITISFKAKASASAQVSFSSGSILAADGKGTNILANMNGGSYTLKPKIITPPAEEIPSEEVAPEVEYIPPAAPASTGVPAAPVIRSSTHPVQEQWYSNNTPEFSWELPSDVTAVKLLIGKLATAVPTVLYTPPISEKKIDEMPDGVYYFHIQFKNQYGWGAITHRQVLIDTEPPAPFELVVDNGGDPTNPAPFLYFETTDSLSGIEHYEVKIDGNDLEKKAPLLLEENPYQLPVQPPGKHTVIIKANDKAGNCALATTDVVIEPLEPPVITEFPETVRVGETLTVKGTSQYPEAFITVFVKKQGEEAETNQVKTNKEGNWTFTYPKSLEKGTYQVWLLLTDTRGAKTEPTDKLTILSALPPFLQFGEIAIDYLTVVITLVSLVIVLTLVIVFGWCRVSFWRKRLRKETKDVLKSLQKTVKILQELEKKSRLTKAEREIRDKLKQAFKEIKDIKKCLQ